MTLTDIIESAAVGFVSGVLIGASPKANEAREILAQYDALHVPGTIQDPTTKKRIKVHEFENFMYTNLSVPAIVAGSYALIDKFARVENTPGNFESLFSAVPASIVGATVGRAIRRFVKREYYHDLKLLKYMVSDRDRAHEYLPKHQKRALNDIFTQVEQRTLDDADNIFDDNENTDYEKLIELTFGDDDSAYIPWIKNWANTKVNKIFEDSLHLQSLQNQILETFNDIADIAVSTPFVPTSTQIRVFEKSGRNLNIYEGDFEEVNLLINNGNVIRCIGKDPKVRKLHSERLGSDYRKLAKRIYAEMPHSTPILLKTSRPLHQNEFEDLLTESYLTEFQRGQLTLLNYQESLEDPNPE